MPDREFNEQILKTQAQWKSGLRVGLSLGAEGLSLFATPSLETWLDRSPLGVDIVTDQCGQVWWVALDSAGGHWQLNRLDPKTGETEHVIAMHDCDRIRPRKLWLTAETLLMFDERNARILGFSRENFQIVFEIGIGEGNLVDIDFARATAFHALIEREGGYSLCRFLMPPNSSGGKCVPLADVVEPVAVAVSPKGYTYVLAADRGRLLRFKPKFETTPKEKPDELAAPSEAILKHFKPSIFEFDSRNVVFLAGTSIFAVAELMDPLSLAGKLKNPQDAVSRFISHGLSVSTGKGLSEWSERSAEVPTALRDALVNDINKIIVQGSIWEKERFASVPLRPATDDLLKRKLRGAGLVQLNRFLLEDAYEKEFSRTIRLHQFDADGSYIGEARLPAEIESITGIGFHEDHICIATDQGLVRLSLNLTPVGQSGLYYCRALDNGEQEGFWHGFEFEGRLPARTSVEISYHVSSEGTLKKSYDDVLKSKAAPDEQQKQIEKLLGRRWNRPVPAAGDGNQPAPEVFRGSNSAEDKSAQPETATQDMLFLYNKGRYLFLKITLTTFDENNRPQIASARILYQRKSYLRYLPAVYSEDPLAAAFLERFLSLFETVFEGLEEEITDLFHYFDPDDVRPRFLAWLQSWLNLAVDLPEDRLRRLLRQAPDIFSRKGTPSALAQFLEIYTGKRVVLIEHSRLIQPLVLGLKEMRLGLRTVLVSPGADVFRVGDTSIVGGAVLGAPETTPEAAFRPFIRRFSILVDLERSEFAGKQVVLRRIVDEHKPAHTICSLGILSTRNRVGTAQLGINSTVTDIGPYRVGFSPLGEASAIAKGPPAPRMERGSRYGGKEGI